MSALSPQPPFVPGPIISAGAVSLSDSISGQPYMTESLLDYFRSITIGVVTAAIQDTSVDTQDGTARETIRWTTTYGCFQPGSAEKLEIKPEGERSWKNGVLHTLPAFNVPTDTVLIVKNARYRVMETKDFSDNGYVRYQLLETYVRRS